MPSAAVRPPQPLAPTPPTGLAAVRQRIDAACRAAGRPPGSVTCIAASKTVPAEALLPVLDAGQRHFGENRVQEAIDKWPELRPRYPDVAVHLIGPVQSNKVRDAVALADAIHSVDRPSLCRALAREIDRQGRQPQVFVQVNTGAEPQKSGVLPTDADAFLDACRRIYHLDVVGLMCIPPAADPPAEHFDLLASIAERNGLPGLSMGMSGDYAEAIAHGATHVRVGSAIFGART
jgi:PLP dependent protein